MGEITGRMAFHFVMVLVGLLEASMAAKREQRLLLPTHRLEALVDGVPFFFFSLIFFPLEFYYSYEGVKELFLMVWNLFLSTFSIIITASAALECLTFLSRMHASWRQLSGSSTVPLI